jgi:hypothetical protein
VFGMTLLTEKSREPYQTYLDGIRIAYVNLQAVSQDLEQKT